MPEPTTIARYLRAVALLPTEGPSDGPTDGPTDAELLARFATARDQGAFELLVWRHAGMVTAVCHRVLRDRHTAEDATQAAFLALARKASSVRENPAGWLFRVARRIAVKMASRRVVLPTASTTVTPAVNDDVEVLHDELARLPDKYRLPVLLCFFEGLSHADAARRLGWPAGTVAGRIARAKDTLHARLTRRGVAVPAAGLSALCVATDVTGTFAESTTRAAIVFVSGTALSGIPEHILLHAKGAIRDMVISKLQMVSCALMVATALVTGGVWALGRDNQSPPNVRNERPASGKSAEPKQESTEAQNIRIEKLKRIFAAFMPFRMATGKYPNNSHESETGKPLLSWRVHVLPYLGQAELYKKFKLNEPWDSDHNRKLLAEMPDVYRTSTQAKDVTDTHYRTFAGRSPGAPFDPCLQVSMVDPSGRSLNSFGVAENSFGVAEVGPAVPWTKPTDVPYQASIDNAKLITELEALLKDHNALLKLRNALTKDVEKSQELSVELKRMIDMYKPRIKHERDKLGLFPNAKIPDPKDLPKP